MNRYYKITRPLAILALGSLSSLALHAQEAASENDKIKDKDTVVLQSLTVSDSAETSNLQAAAVDLTKVAGSTSLISLDQVSKGRVGTAADVLAFQPGVFAQSAGGTDALRVSIRGSGINRGQGSFREGITFLFDGLPVTGPGGSPYELFEPLGLSYTAILRGANGFKYGGLALGGAINYVTNTGYDSSIAEGRFEFGSYGYKKAQVASGSVVGKADYYATVIGSYREGYEDLTKAYSSRVIGNFGYKFNDTVSNRVFFRFGATTNENPGSLTLSQIQNDPTQSGKANGTVSPSNILWNAAYNNSTNPLFYSRRIQQGSTWIGDKLTVKIDPDSTLDIGAVFHDYPIDIQGTTANLGRVTSAQKAVYPFLTVGTPVYQVTTPGLALGGIRSVWGDDDVTLSAKYNHNGELFGKTSITDVGILTTEELTGQVKTYTDNSKTTETQNRKYSGSSNTVLSASNETEVAPKLWATLASQLSYIVRKAEYTYIAPYSLIGGQGYGINNPNNIPLNYSREVVRFAPRFGLRYDITPDIQVFGNVSHTVEPADSWKYNAIRTSNTLINNVGVQPWTNLKEQQADTVEIGTRGKAGRFDGGVTVYRSWLKDELLTAVDPNNLNTTNNFNASNTIHQGVEVTLNTLLWQEGGIDNKPTKGEQLDKVSFRQAFTYSDFFYVNDGASPFPVNSTSNLNNGHNKLPGLPPEFYQGELLFEHSSGFYLGLNTQVSSNYYVDYKNTLKAPSYNIFGAKIGYAPPKQKWETYLEFKNLFNTHYATAVTPVYNASTGAGTQATAAFQPGDGFSVFGGVSYKF